MAPVCLAEEAASATLDSDANLHAGAAQDPVIATAKAIDEEAYRVQRHETEAGKRRSNDEEAEAVHP